MKRAKFVTELKSKGDAVKIRVFPGNTACRWFYKVFFDEIEKLELSERRLKRRESAGTSMKAARGVGETLCRFSQSRAEQPWSRRTSVEQSACERADNKSGPDCAVPRLFRPICQTTARPRYTGFGLLAQDLWVCRNAGSISSVIQSSAHVCSMWTSTDPWREMMNNFERMLCKLIQAYMVLESLFGFCHFPMGFISPFSHFVSLFFSVFGLF